MRVASANTTPSDKGPTDPVERLNKIRERIDSDGVKRDFLEGELLDGADENLNQAAQADPASTSIIPMKRLPMWADCERAGPNILMRSSIFGIAPPRTKRWVAGSSEPREVIVLGDIQISMIGEELRQEDADVLFGILHLARITNRYGGGVEFTASDFIRELGWSRDGRSYHRLHGIIRRLASTTFIVSGKNVSLDNFAERGFTLLQYDFVRDTERRYTGKWHVTVAASTVNLFWIGHYSRIHWDLHKEIRSPLARYLHLLYATYKGALSFGLEQLHALCGSQQKHLPAFRQAVIRAQEELHELGIIDRWGWTDSKRKRLRVEMNTISTIRALAQQEFSFMDPSSNDLEPVTGQLTAEAI
ncbi:MAG: hypothetical protein GX771_10790 [Halomonadaceae bacterium]|nr:hypothetical protein [Halomonadaceae bacterium]